MEKSKNVLITGASTGIGYDLAKAFVNRGYQVYGSVRKEEDAERLSKELGERFEALLFDVTDHDSVERAAALLDEKVGAKGLGGLINNAGIAVGGPFLDLDIEDFRYQFEVNVIGLVKVTQAFLPLLGARENHSSLPGRLLQISSSAGKISMPFMSAYSGSKHAVEGISQSLRRELQLYGIEVVIIGQGPVKTPIWNKGIGEGYEKRFEESPFAHSLNIFQNVFVKNTIKKAWTSEKAAHLILKAFEKSRPKVRYALIPQYFKNWILPNLLPDRALDIFVKKNLKLFK